MKPLIFLLAILLTVVACRKRTPEELKARSEGKFKINLPMEKQGQMMAVIETSAGSHHLTKYNTINHQFEKVSKDSKPIVNDYLSVPFNLGFIPSTTQELSRGGNGDPVQVIVLSGKIPSEMYTPIEAIGLITIIEKGTKRKIVIAKSLDEDYSSIKADDISLLPKGVLEIISNWLCNHKGNNSYQLDSWGIQRDALAHIKKWKLN